MAIIDVSAGDTLAVADVVQLASDAVYYGSMSAADAYFSTKLYAASWFKCSPERREVALVEASRIIDGLAFSGTAASADGIPKFPQVNVDGVELPIPRTVPWATYEIAIQLLRNADVDRQIAALSVTSQGFASARTSREANILPDHLRAGVPSIFAWRYLTPLLADYRKITFAQ